MLTDEADAFDCGCAVRDAAGLVVAVLVVCAAGLFACHTLATAPTLPDHTFTPATASDAVRFEETP